jgi:RNA polymerase sigma factor (sigma-70 family)
MGPEIDDDALLVAAVDDPEAFAQFYRHHVCGVLAYFRRRPPDAETAADLTAETFAAALEGRRRYEPERGPAAAWLYRIARRRLIALQRHGRVERGARRRRACQGRRRARRRDRCPRSACGGLRTGHRGRTGRALGEARSDNRPA